MIEVELLGPGASSGSTAAQRSSLTADLPSVGEMRHLCVLAAESAGVRDGHLAIEFVDEQRIMQLNAQYRERPSPTDVLSFPVDGADANEVVRELGDVIICPEHTIDVREAIVHGVLHLVGMDHETDNGEMLALQDELLARAAR
jgi:probable rRNA maturation factor